MSEWLEVCPLSQLERRRKVLVSAEPYDIVVWWFDGAPHAMRDLCVHADRSLSSGSLLGRRVVCPGHQWGFDVVNGDCPERSAIQPTYETRVDDGTVFTRSTPRATP